MTLRLYQQLCCPVVDCGAFTWIKHSIFFFNGLGQFDVFRYRRWHFFFVTIIHEPPGRQTAFETKRKGATAFEKDPIKEFCIQISNQAEQEYCR
jgi:hypothetical protein